jgi:uncharacterized membrane protein (DUF2068 family)
MSHQTHARRSPPCLPRGAGRRMPQPTGPSDAASTGGIGPQAAEQRSALRAVAVFEALKGAVALAAGLGLLSLLHRDLHQAAASLIGHIGLNPGGRYPAMVLHDVDQLQAARVRPMLLAAALYVCVRWCEACGLWRGRVWAEWLGAASGALYIPFELQHFSHHPTLFAAAVIAVNLALVAFLLLQLRRQHRAKVK